ncbi:MAG: imidazole glycerol phosphate synthase subunit HisH [Gemmatimonadaceae bacterium]|nr:imidazole glycerol phosphate synthase subunit HisH [Gemmatimonadaceae bacterium]
MIATVLDFGVGNVHSLTRGLLSLGLSIEVTDNPREALASELLVLPGVGAFSAAARQLAPVREELRAALADGLPCLAICLGMQLLFHGSEEGQGKGIGLIGGCSTRLTGDRVPHMGWNTVATASPLLSDSQPMYFAHSYACRPNDPSAVGGWTDCDGDRFPALVQTARTTGVQFHPEKSGEAGRAFLRTWIKEVERCA